MDKLLDYFTKIAARDCRGPIKFLKMFKVTLQQIVQFSINFLNPIGKQYWERLDEAADTFPPKDDDVICVYCKNSSMEALVLSCSHVRLALCSNQKKGIEFSSGSN